MGDLALTTLAQSVFNENLLCDRPGTRPVGREPLPWGGDYVLGRRDHDTYALLCTKMSHVPRKTRINWRGGGGCCSMLGHGIWRHRARVGGSQGAERRRTCPAFRWCGQKGVRRERLVRSERRGGALQARPGLQVFTERCISMCPVLWRNPSVTVGVGGRVGDQLGPAGIDLEIRLGGLPPP